MNRNSPRWLVPLGRAVVASLFVLGGVNKIMNYAATQEAMADAALPLAWLLLPLTILLELGGGLIVALGMPFHRQMALLLAAFTLLVNFVFHPFWTFPEEPMATLQLSLFFKNVAIAGALVMVAGLPDMGRRKSL